MRFWSATALVTHMLELREQRDLKRFLTQVEKHELLVLDELGYVPFSKDGAELLFEVVSRAYERLSLIRFGANPVAPSSMLRPSVDAFRPTEEKMMTGIQG